MSTTEHEPGAVRTSEVPQGVVEGDAVPPVGEEIHLPGGSILPLVVALGVTLLVIGTTIWWVWSALGFIVTAVAAGIWIRDTRRDIDALPEEHH